METTSPNPSDSLWKTEDVARYLRVSTKTVFNLRKRGLPYVQLAGAAVRFSPQEITDYLASQRHLALHRERRIARNGSVQ